MGVVCFAGSRAVTRVVARCVGMPLIMGKRGWEFRPEGNVGLYEERNGRMFRVRRRRETKKVK